jgi:hypothetical protein
MPMTFNPEPRSTSSSGRGQLILFALGGVLVGYAGSQIQRRTGIEGWMLPVLIVGVFAFVKAGLLPLEARLRALERRQSQA